MAFFNTALSGLNAASTHLNVIGNNIANASTIGFKGSRAQFADLFAMSNLGQSQGLLGAGVEVSGIRQDFAQGNLTFTANNFDMAITGSGFFRLDDGGEILYTRSGSFGLDRDGYVVNGQGQRLTGYSADASGVISGGIGPLQLDTSDIAPQASSQLAIGVNVDATETEPATAFDIADASSYNHSTSLTAYDSLGNSVLVTTYYRKTANPNEWEVYTYATDPSDPDNPVEIIPAGGVAGDPMVMTFDADGGISSVSPNNGSALVGDYTAVTLGTGADPLELDIDFGNSTQYGTAFTVNTLSQDGYTTGRMSTVVISAEGVMTVRYTNGQTRTAAQIALADFNNPQGLQQLGNNTWGESYDSGAPLVGTPGTGTLGAIYSGALENSNVDLTAQLVNMIEAQRNFQANAQVISTADSLTQTLINLR